MVIRQADKLDKTRKVLYKAPKLLVKNQQVSGLQGMYVVEISTTDDLDLYIAAFDTNSPESLLIEIPDENRRE
jgi:hypothetical protein